MKQLLLLIIISLWAAFATYQWAVSGARATAIAQVSYEKASLETQVAVLEQAALAQREGAKVSADTQVVYKTIKDVVYKNQIVNQCAGTFPDELRLGLSEAVGEANRTMPATQH